MDPLIENLKSTTFFGKRLTRRQIADIQETVGLFPKLSRTELGHTICEHLRWQTPKGSNRIHLATCCISLCFDKILQIIPMQGRGILWISSLLQERVTVASLTETYGSTGPLPGLNSLLQ